MSAVVFRSVTCVSVLSYFRLIQAYTVDGFVLPRKHTLQFSSHSPLYARHSFEICRVTHVVKDFYGSIPLKPLRIHSVILLIDVGRPSVCISPG